MEVILVPLEMFGGQERLKLVAEEEEVLGRIGVLTLDLHSSAALGQTDKAIAAAQVWLITAALSLLVVAAVEEVAPVNKPL